MYGFKEISTMKNDFFFEKQKTNCRSGGWGESVSGGLSQYLFSL